MKIVNPSYEWETDEIQQEIDEAKLKQVYSDTKTALSLELGKIEKVRNDGKIELERVKAELQKDLKMTESSDTLIKTQTDVRKLAKELQHETQQNELDRESKEEIEKMKSQKSIK